MENKNKTRLLDNSSAFSAAVCGTFTKRYKYR